MSSWRRLGALFLLGALLACSSSGGQSGADSATSVDTRGGLDGGGDAGGERPVCGRQGFVPASASATAPETGLLYVASSTEGLPNERLVVQIYDEFAGPDQPGTYRLDGINYADCGLCLLVYAGCTGPLNNTCEKVFYAQQGLVDILELGGAGQRFAARLRGVVFDEVDIDPGSFVSTPVAGGETWCADGYAFDEEVGSAASPCGGEGQTCVGETVGDFQIQNCETGNMVSVHSLLGRMKALWLVLTAGWCGACDQWVPEVLGFTDEHALRGLRTVIIYGEDEAGNKPSLENCRAHARKYAEDAGRFYLDHDGVNSFAATFDHVYVYPDASGSFGLPWNGVVDARSKEFVYADGAGVSGLMSVLQDLLNL